MSKEQREAINERAKQYLKWDRNKKYHKIVEQLVEKNDYEKLKKIMGTPLEFGTAGLRAAMGPGFSCMNDVTVIQAAQGLAAHILKAFGDQDASTRGIIIGYDARHNSQRFARLSANVFLSNGIKTYLFRQIVPTPFVAFGLRHCGCLAGVMVTASHNPKQDNGYKVYWNNGAQIVSPIDASIAACIKENQEPKDAAWTEQPGAQDPYDDVYKAFYSSLTESDIMHYRDINARSKVKITYSAMHGVGTPFTMEAMRVCGFREDNFVMVKEQIDPDPDFPTVTFPNPEEPSSLKMAMEVADANGSNIILANDPDADRLAVAQKIAGVWRVFTGNQIGTLLGWWLLRCHKEFNKDVPVEKCAMLSSAVSSKILNTMARREGFYFEETLTGFKYMGSRSNELVKPSNGGYKVLFAFEEAIGFMCGDRVWDKDGVTAAVVFAEMIAWLAEVEGKTLWIKGTELFAHYGSHYSYNSYVISRSPAMTRAMFEEMRTLENGKYPSHVEGIPITRIRDLGVGLDTAQPDKRATLPISKTSPMITFYFKNGINITFRASGTEPKLKWYSEIIGSTSYNAYKDLVEFVDTAVETLMQPTKFGFVPRSKL